MKLKNFNKEFNFKFWIILGKGTFWKVKKCQSNNNKKYYAIKKLNVLVVK